MERIGRRAWIVYAVAVGAYTVAVLQRTSLSVAGLDAAARLDVSAGVLGTFAVVQLLVYAGMQVPVGVMVDRVGPRALVVTGAALMAAGQTSLALAESFPAALAARVLVGAGDAMTFIAVLRLVTAWFPPRRVPLMTQVTGLVGQTGQLLSIIPLAALLHGPGWTPAFLSAASLSLLFCALAFVVVRDTPGGNRTEESSPSWTQVRDDLASAWKHPGTRLGLWTHFTTPFATSAFLLLWGYPFLVSGQGMTRAEASALFTLMTVVAIVVAPFLGEAVARHPLRRSWLVLSIVGATVAVWTAVLVLPGPAPRWLLLLLVVVLALGGPASMIGFDFARTFNPPNRIGTATGIVNVGGFVSALVVILLVGVVLDLVGSGTSYSLEGFRAAFSVQYVVWALGVAGILRTRRVVRARLAEEGVVVPPMREALRRRRASRRGLPR
ncbi:MAG: nitrate/nitrite transporter [Candidatus Nanopelagicales bacterium]